MGSFVVANPRRLGCASTQDDKASGSIGGKEAARFVGYRFKSTCSLQNAPFPSSCYPLDPVILNELVLSLRSTSEMKDLLIYARI
jgi:hypothetical protein